MLQIRNAYLLFFVVVHLPRLSCGFSWVATCDTRVTRTEVTRPDDHQDGISGISYDIERDDDDDDDERVGTGSEIIQQQR